MSRPNARLALTLTALMIAAPLAAGTITVWSGPNAVASSGQAVTVDGFSVPGNATILDGWVEIGSDAMPAIGNGTRVGAGLSANFTQGSHQSTVTDVFDGPLSLDVDAAAQSVNTFPGLAILSFQQGILSGGTNSSIWQPSLVSQINGTRVGNGTVLSHGTIPASASEGSIVAATLPGNPVPAGSDVWLSVGNFSIPHPVNNFTFTFDHWLHSGGSGDGAWVEYSLDGGSWTWIEPDGGYDTNMSNPPSVNGTGGSGVPVWQNSTASGWRQATFTLDNVTGINNASDVDVRFRYATASSGSTPSPGWFIDALDVDNQGNSSAMWHHGCHVMTGTCGYSNNAESALQTSTNLSGSGSNLTLRTRLEWDLEGSGWDNLCIELSTNNNTWWDISSTGGAQNGTACRSRTGAIPSNGYTVGGNLLGDESGGFVTLDLDIPAAFENQSVVHLRYHVQTDGSVTQGGVADEREGVSLNDVKVISSNGTTLFHDDMMNATTMFHYAIGGNANDWMRTNVGAGQMSLAYGFEDSPAQQPSSWPAGWSTSSVAGTDGWQFGALNATLGPISFPSAPYGFATNLHGAYMNSAWEHLFTPGYQIPAGARVRFTFDHWMCAEQSYDAGALFISTNNNSWAHVNPGIGFYDGTAGFGANNLANLEVWDGRNHVPPGAFSCIGPHNLWQAKQVDLAQYAGQTVWFRFSFESDSIINRDGWYIDDVGVEVDQFVDSGTWTSDSIPVEELGNGFIDVDATVPENTSIRATVTTASGTPLGGMENRTLPLSLAGIDRDSLGSIRVELHLFTSDIHLTPIVHGLHVGSVRIFDPSGGGNGWSIPNGMEPMGSTMNNSGGTTLTLESPFLGSTAPIGSVSIFGSASNGVTVRAFDAAGNSGQPASIGGTISFSTPQPGFGIEIVVPPGGWLGSLNLTGNMVQPAINPMVDVTDDGTTDWSFPEGSAYGWYGWQQFVSAGGSASGSSHQVTIGVPNASGVTSADIDVLIPADSTVMNGLITISPITPTFTSDVDVEVAGVSLATVTSGSNATDLILDAATISAVQQLGGTHTDSSTARDWREVTITLDASSSQAVKVTSSTFGYEAIENVTGLTSQLTAYHASIIASNPPPMVDIPVTVTADRGALSITGGIEHEMMITNLRFTVPTTLYPDGQLVTIVTKHHHLNDNSEIGRIVLTGDGSDDNDVGFELTGASDLSSASFSQTEGGGLARLDLNASSVREVPGSGGFTDIEVTWAFEVLWTWDDVSEIEWMANALDLSGEGIAPAYATSGGSGAQAVENDLEVDSLSILDAKGRVLSDPFSADYPFPVRALSTVDVSGSVRFQNTAGHRPGMNDFAAAITVAGTSVSLNATGAGTFGGSVDLPASIDAIDISSLLARVGPADGGTTGATDETVAHPSYELIPDSSAPNASALQVSTSFGLLEADGFVWDPSSPLIVHAILGDDLARSDAASLRFWREAIDDDNLNGKPDAEEYGWANVSLNIGQPGDQQVTFPPIQVSQMAFNDRISLFLEGNDWAGLTYQEGGTGGGPGFVNDWATMFVASNEPTTLIPNGLSLDTVEGYLLAGQMHTLSIEIEDRNGVSTLDEIEVLLCGDDTSALGLFRFDPRQNDLSSDPASHIDVHEATVVEIDEERSMVEITFTPLWTYPWSDDSSLCEPGIRITDDQELVANVNNIGELAWRLDNTLLATPVLIEDMTPPITVAEAASIAVQQGDEISISGTVSYGGSGAPLTAIPENLQVSASVTFGSQTIEAANGLASDSSFEVPMVLPSRTPLTPTMPIALIVLNVPGEGNSSFDESALLTVDSTPPRIVFDPSRFPTGSLTLLESDRLDAVRVQVVVEDAGGMPDGELTVHWVYLRNGLPIASTSGQDAIPRTSTEGVDHVHEGFVDFSVPAGTKLVEGDQLAIWFDATDRAGNPALGSGTEDSPRVPTLRLIEFEPSLQPVEVSPRFPHVGQLVRIDVTMDNLGLRQGNVSVQIAERLSDGQWVAGDERRFMLGPGETGVTHVFEWEAWEAGSPDLHVVIDADFRNTTAIDSIQVQASEEGVAGASSTMMMGGIAVILLGVVAMTVILFLQRAGGDDEWEEESGWGDIGATAEITPPPPTTGLDPEVSDALAMLPDDWTAARVEQYRSGGWSISQIVSNYGTAEAPPPPAPSRLKGSSGLDGESDQQVDD